MENLLTNLSAELGFIVIQTNQPNLISITTPHTFASGDPVHFYLQKRKGQLILDDYGMNLNSFQLSLPMPEKASRIIKQKLHEFDNKIQFDGYHITRFIQPNEHAQAMSEIMTLFGTLTNFQPKTTHEQDKNIILHDIMIYLKDKYENIQPNYHTKGVSGTQYEFDFLADKTLIDFIPAHFNSTGAVLRKILDINQVYDEYDYRIIINDKDKQQAQKEAKIIMPLAKVVPLSLIQKRVA